MAGGAAHDPSYEALISVVTYLWEGPRGFKPAYVSALARMVAHHLPEPHRFICVTDSEGPFSKEVEVFRLPPAARELAQLSSPEGNKFPASYRRLWTFSKEAKSLGERVLLLDIDCMVVSDMRPLFKWGWDFIGWNVRPPPGGPPRFGGGTWLLRTGTRTAVYERFMANPVQSMRTAREAGYRGSDQAWISYCLRRSEPHWPEPSGIYCAQDYWNLARPAILGQPRRMLSKQYGHKRVQFSRRRIRPMPARPIRRQSRWPADAIILHTNGAFKQWDVDDEISRKYWKPFLDGVDPVLSVER